MALELARRDTTPAQVAGGSHPARDLALVTGAMPEDARDLAARLFEGADPTMPASYISATTRDVRRVYPDVVFGSARRSLCDAIVNRERLFIHGQGVGVHASAFAADYANSFNAVCEERGDPRRVLFFMVPPGTRTEKPFLRGLSASLQVPLDDAVYRARSVHEIGECILAQLLRLRIAALILDRPSCAPESVRSVIVHLMMITDPTYAVRLEPSSMPQPRIGVILVDTDRAGAVFKANPLALDLLENREVKIGRCNSLEAIYDYLRNAGIGMEDFDQNDPDDVRLAERVRELTRGARGALRGLLRVLNQFADANGGCRPNAELLEAAVAYHKMMMGAELPEAPTPRPAHGELESDAESKMPEALDGRVGSRARRAPKVKGLGGLSREVIKKKGTDDASAKILKKKRQSLGRADSVRSEIVRRPTVVLPNV